MAPSCFEIQTCWEWPRGFTDCASRVAGSTAGRQVVSCFMENKPGSPKAKLSSAEAAEELDSLNSDLRGGEPRSSDRLRRKIETSIEAKAQKRRKREVAASQALKRRTI